MRKVAKRWSALSGLAILLTSLGAVQAQDSGDSPIPAVGEGVDSQLLWSTPGPSNFPTIESSDIMGHTGVAFTGMFHYYRNSVGADVDEWNSDGPTGRTVHTWAVENAFVADFLWAFGLFDLLQIGVTLPVVLNQSGDGGEKLLHQVQDSQTGTAEWYDETEAQLSSSALKDLRFNIKARLLGGKAPMPDRRDFGLALDLGVSLPTGSEMAFAGDRGVVFFPTAIVDFHRCKFSAAANLGARLRLKKSSFVYSEVGHQGVVGLGATGHLLDRRLLLSAEGQGVMELDGFRFAMEFRGAVGFVADKSQAITVWVSAGSSAGSDDLYGAPEIRMLASVVYAPGQKEPIHNN